jgi:hypothetical protein
MTDRPRSTFRDPSGYVEFTAEEVRRHIYPAEAEAGLRFLRSSLCETWQSSGRMVTGEIEDTPQGEVLIHHPRIFPLVSVGMGTGAVAGCRTAKSGFVQ